MLGDLEKRRELRHADPGDHPGGADRARADPDLDRIGAGVDQRLGAGERGDIAGDQLHRVARAAHPCDRVEHAGRMAMRGIDHQDIDARLDQRLGALQAGRAGADRGADPQPRVGVLARAREGLRLLDVLDRHQPDQPIVVVDHQELFDAMLVQELLGLVAADALGHGDQLVRGHQIAHRDVRIGREAHVAIGQDADQAAVALDHGNPGDAMRRHQVQGIGERGVGRQRDRVDHHARLELLDLLHLGRLRRDLEVAMDHAEAAVLGHGDREVGFGDRVHGRRDQRDAELDLTGQPGLDVDLGRQHLGACRLEQNVVEGQGFADHQSCHAGLVRSLNGAGYIASWRRRAKGGSRFPKTWFCGPERCHTRSPPVASVVLAGAMP